MLRIGEFDLDDAALEVRHAGRCIRLPARPFELLERLARDAGRVVRKDQLMADLWPAQVVSDAALGSAVREVRRALKALGAAEAVRVEVVRGRGYRLSVPGASVAREANAPGAPAVAEARGPCPLVGRDAEIGRLAGALDDVLRGSSRTVIVTGPAGIGKSRLAAQLDVLASARGVDVWWGRCQEGESPPLWPWAEIVRTLVKTRDAEELRPVLRAVASDLIPVLPSVRALFDGEEIPPRPADPELARLSLLDSFIELLESVAERRPCTLFIDDAQWADSSSLLLLRSLAQRQMRGRLLLVVVHRDDELEPEHPAEDVLGSLARVPRVERVALGPLGDEQSRELLRMLGAGSSADPRLEELCQIAGGNPFFLGELYRHLGESGDLGPLPREVERLIGRRLERRTPAARRVIACASVVGMEFSADLVRSLAQADDGPVGDVDDALEELVRAGSIEPPASAGEPHRFAHALTRRAVYERIPPSQRARLHRVIGEHLEASLGGDVPGEETAQLAEHFDLGLDEGTLPRAFSYRVLAGEDADRRLSFEEAARHFARAVALFDAANPPEEAADASGVASRDERRCRLLLALAEAAHKAGNEGVAADALETALPIARRLDDPHYLARLAIQARTVVWEDARMTALHEEAIERLSAERTPLRAVVLASLAARLRDTLGSRQRREALLAEALDITAEAGDASARVHVLDAFLIAMDHSDLLAERLRHATEMHALGTDEGSVWIEAQARAHRHAVLLRQGRLDEALEEVRELRALARRHPWPRIQWLSCGPDFVEAYLDGRLADAEEHCLRVGDLAARTRNPTGYMALAVLLTALRREQGRVKEVLPLAQGFAAERPGFTWAVEISRGYGGDRGALRRLLTSVATERGGVLRHECDDFRLLGLCWLVDACAALGVSEHADFVHAELAPYAAVWAAGGTGFYAFGSVRRLLGNLELLRGRAPCAVEELRRSLESHDQPGATLLRLWTRFDLARALRQRARSRDIEEADRLLDETYAEACGRELTDLSRRIEAHRSALA